MRIQLIWGPVEEHDYSHVESFWGSFGGLTEFGDHGFPVQYLHCLDLCMQVERVDYLVHVVWASPEWGSGRLRE